MVGNISTVTDKKDFSSVKLAWKSAVFTFYSLGNQGGYAHR